MSQVFNGLASGLLLALIATGLTVIYGTLGVINFAHGALFVVGAYAGFSAYGQTGSFALAVVAGALVTLVLGLVIERGIIQRFYRRPPEDQLLVTFGLGIVLVEAVRSIYGGIAQRFDEPSWGSGVAHIGSLIYPMYRLQSLGFAAATLFVLYLVLYRTRLGLVVRAGIEDAGMVSMLGINVQRAFLLVFGIGAAAAGYSGVINSPIVSLTPDMGSRVLVDSFVVIVIGGVGSFPGAIVGGIIAGEILSLTSIVDPAYSDVMLFAVMALVLIFRPQGLMGQEGRE
ncbi:MAG: branched-chain amino acid ABC transporter permease [Burkholderiales bacterium]|nr:branched-chain amino acid ABC transporter permease [Burkholderiales bacterium]MDE2277083.1 branched-chain amino acid ABC transporter permease [Burkholderiales bacterium]